MTPVYDFEISRYAGLRKKFVWRDRTGRPMKLAGCAARMQLRPSPESDVVLLELSTDNGRIHLGDVNGAIELDVDESVTAALSFSSAVYDLLITDSQGNVTRLVEGSVTLAGVTR
jgi:hypothetical protein